MKQARPISWIKAARKEFDTSPREAQAACAAALADAANGGKHDLAKPLSGLGSRVLEIALPTAAMLSASCTPCS